MSQLPNTRTSKPRRKTLRWATIFIFAALLVAGVLVAAQAPGEDFAPGEEILSPIVADIAAGTGGEPFPRRDAARFDGGTEVVRVYLRVEDLPPGREMTASVERSARSSLVTWFSGGGIRAEGGEVERLSVSENGVSGVVSFAVRAEGALPAGEYSVEVRSAGRESSILARKYFVVGDPQA